MSFILDLIMGDLMPYLAGAVGIIGAWFFAESRGKKKEQAKRTEERLAGINNAQKIKKEVDDADRDTVIDINSK